VKEALKVFRAGVIDLYSQFNFAEMFSKRRDDFFSSAEKRDAQFITASFC